MLGSFLAYIVLHQGPSVEDIHRMMSRIVRIEELEEHERLAKVRMMRSKRKHYRTDQGPNAIMRTMRVRRRRRM